MRARGRLLPVAIIAAAAALRLVDLGQQSFWYDESFTVRLVRGSFGDMLSGVAHTESTPPLYYALAWVWGHVFGTGEIALRSLSALLGTALVLVAYLLGRRLGGRTAGALAALLTAVNPMLVWYSQESRAYALASLAGLLTVLAALEARRRASPAALGLWVLSAAAALTSHYFTVFLVVPEAAWLLWTWSRPRRSVAVAVAGVAAALGALLPLALAQRERSAFLAVGPDDLAHRAAAIPKQFLLGATAAQIDARWVVALAAALGLAGIVAVVRAAPRDAGVRELAALGALGVLLPAAAALVAADYLNARNVVPALAVLLTALAVAASARDLRRLGLVAVLGLAGLFLAVDIAIRHSASLQRDDWKGAAQTMAAGRGGPVVVVIEPAGGEAPLSLYLPNLRAARGGRLRANVVWALALTRPPGPVPAADAGPGLRPGPLIRTPSYVLRRYRLTRRGSFGSAGLARAVFPGASVSVQSADRR